MGIIPAQKPKLSREEALRILKAKGLEKDLCVLAVRGYYEDSMGKPGVNDRAFYDDAVFVCSPTFFGAFNWNTDPTSYRRGYGTAESTKGMATLKPGVWEYKIGTHRGTLYPAGVQAQRVTVIRDGSPDYPDTGWFGINLHTGSLNTTSSAGCQTCPPDQWDDFIGSVVDGLKEYNQATFKYVLITNNEMKELLKGEPAKPSPESTDGAPWLNVIKEMLLAILDVIKKMMVGESQPGEKRNLSAAVKIIKEFEGLYLKAYLDPVGIPTIGWGTIRYPDGIKVKMGDTCTKEQAETWLMYEVRGCAKDVESLVKVPVNDNQFCALVSLAYNVGSDIDVDDIAEGLGDSTLLKKLNAGDYKGAADEFPKWVKAGGQVLSGLVRRRSAERDLFLS